MHAFGLADSTIKFLKRITFKGNDNPEPGPVVPYAHSTSY